MIRKDLVNIGIGFVVACPLESYKNSKEMQGVVSPLRVTLILTVPHLQLKRDVIRSLDTSILHHAFILIFIASWDYYLTLCHNTYGYSLLFYKVYMKRENAGSWDSGLEKEQILETHSAQLQKS